MTAGPLELVHLFRARFPVHPVPPYPDQMGLDPTGEIDEYAGFAGQVWTDVEIEHFRGTGFDICPSIGFRLYKTPHMWNYYLPGFVTASLRDDPGFMTLDGVLWGLYELQVPVPSKVSREPWWGGTVHFEHYSRDQMAAVVAFLRFVLGDQDDWTLSQWEQALARA